MANSGVLFLVLLVFTTIYTARSTPPGTVIPASSQAFIQLSCKKTLYADFCIKSLTRFAPTRELDSRDLVHIALTVSLVKARYTRAYVLSVASKFKAFSTSRKDTRAIIDCLSQVSDGVDHLSRSIRELRRITKSWTQEDFDWCSSNIETWLSAVVTETGTCLDEFPGKAIGGKTKAVVKAKVMNVSRASSVALALYKLFAANYRSKSP